LGRIEEEDERRKGRGRDEYEKKSIVYNNRI
jgi:hypothetical protein